MPPSILAY